MSVLPLFINLYQSGLFNSLPTVGSRLYLLMAKPVQSCGIPA